MLISHQYRFIFIKTHKTAGTSIEVDLARYLAPEDVVTPIRPPEPGHEARNYDHPGWLMRRILKRNYWNHMPAREVRRVLGRKRFESYFKFCVEREPVAKCQSLYAMKTRSPEFNRKDHSLGWQQFLDRGRLPTDAGLYLDEDDTLLVDRILEYENLAEELGEICVQLGIPFKGLETRAKSGFSNPVEVTQEQRAQIYAAFARSLPFTGYSL